MQSGDIVGKIVKTRQFDVQWRVENFESLDATPDTVFYSPSFTDPSGLTRWGLEIYPGGHADDKSRTRHVSLYLLLESPGPVRAKFSFSTVDSAGSLTSTQSQDKVVVFSVSDNSLGFPRFLSRTSLLTTLRSELLSDGHLTVHCRVCIKEVPLEARYPAVAGHNLSALRYNRNYDLTLVVGSDEFKTHRLVLTTVSPVFAAMFEHETKEKEESRVVIEDTKPPVVALLLDFAYDGWLDLNDDTPDIMDTIEALLVAADKYQIDSLQRLCTRQLVSRLSPDTATRLLLIADRIHLENLYRDVLEVVKNNSYTVMTSHSWIEALDTQTAVIKKALKALANMDTASASESVKTPDKSEPEEETKPPAKRLRSSRCKVPESEVLKAFNLLKEDTFANTTVK